MATSSSLKWNVAQAALIRFLISVVSCSWKVIIWPKYLALSPLVSISTFMLSTSISFVVSELWLLRIFVFPGWILSLWEARSRPGCQGPQRSRTGCLSTTSWKMKLSGRRKNRVLREIGDQEEEVNGEVESIRETHNEMTHGTCA